MSSLEHSTLPSLPALTVGGHGSHDDDRFCAGPTWDERDDEGREQLSELDQRTCNNCGKVFQRPSDVRRHSLVHTGVRPYVCAVSCLPTDSGHLFCCVWRQLASIK